MMMLLTRPTIDAIGDSSRSLRQGIPRFSVDNARMTSLMFEIVSIEKNVGDMLPWNSTELTKEGRCQVHFIVA